MATPSSCAANAKFRFTFPPSSKPPVIEEIRSGALSRLPRKVALKSISARVGDLVSPGVVLAEIE